jgi:hypothetical protein
MTQTPPVGSVAGVLPAGTDADQYDEWDEDFPVALDRLPREGRVGNSEDCQNQHKRERQFIEPKAKS